MNHLLNKYLITKIKFYNKCFVIQILVQSFIHLLLIYFVLPNGPFLKVSKIDLDFIFTDLQCMTAKCDTPKCSTFYEIFCTNSRFGYFFVILKFLY